MRFKLPGNKSGFNILTCEQISLSDRIHSLIIGQFDIADDKNEWNRHVVIGQNNIVVYNYKGIECKFDGEIFYDKLGI